MRDQNLYVPSIKMVERYGASAHKHAQDVVVCTDHADGRGSTFAVIDGANNFLGRTSHPSRRVALARRLTQDRELNGGEIISTTMKLTVLHPWNHKFRGLDLINLLNSDIADEYFALGIKPADCPRGELFTGYIGHAIVTDEFVDITAVGDCYVAVNGRIVAGTEKGIDALYSAIVNHFSAELVRDRQAVYQAVMPALVGRQFAFQNAADNPEQVAAFYEELPVLVANLLKLSHKRGRKLMAPLLETAPTSLWYPAIDGTDTPAAGIQHLEIPRSQVRTLVLWTDGFKPAGATVNSLEDLVPVLPEYAERAGIAVDLT